ncbi:MAG: guanylate kinase, partial [Oscillospiraceae bacterium]|nr:guanylate kinase [Oscillospiraceae bacterium]
KERLINRGTETPEAIETRTKTAFAEMRAMPECDYLVINDDLKEAVAQMEAIVAAEKCSVAHNETVINTFLGGIEEC